MKKVGLRTGLVLLLAVGAGTPAVAQAPEGQLTWADHITIAPTWFDPAGTPAIITPFTYDHAIHDALVKPMELDVKKREAILHRLQQLMHDKTMFAPIWELAFISAHGPRVAESGLGLITNLGFSSPYEELKLKAK
jgi:ABC-type transport system substrate-binding protein